MFIIAGLGNPTKQYEGTRHNVGFEVIDRISEKYNIDVDAKKHRALIGKGIIQGQKVILAKPQTYMNLSGESVRSLLDYYKVDEEHELIVIYDDISLDVGQLRIRAKGSAGGHNGMKNIIAHLGSQVFPRIKVGVGEKPGCPDHRGGGHCSYHSCHVCLWSCALQRLPDIWLLILSCDGTLMNDRLHMKKELTQPEKFLFILFLKVI